MVFVTELGNGISLVAVIGGPLFFLDRERFISRFIIIALAIAFGGLLGSIIKDIVGRPRPILEFQELISAGEVQVHTVFDIMKRRSFPSGHTQTAFGAWAAVTYYYRGWYTPILFILALMVGISRIYLGLHFPLDIIAGAVIGVSVASLVCFLGDRVIEKFDIRC